MLFEVPPFSSNISVGSQVRIEANQCLLTRTRSGIKVWPNMVVDNDGLHSQQEASGRVFLQAGMNPIRVDWFNGPAEFYLKLDYQGPNLPRQTVPASALWTKEPSGNWQPGLHYAAYEENGLQELPDFPDLIPKAEGMATNFSTAYRTRDEYCGLTFDGFINVLQSGTYTFYLTSDDGSRLWAGKSSLICSPVSPSKTNSAPAEELDQALADRDREHWIEIEGEVAFVSENNRSLELEVDVAGRRIPVTVLDGVNLFSRNLLHHWIKVEGVCEFSQNPEDKSLVGIFVPGQEQVTINNNSPINPGNVTETVLTTAAQVRRLKPEDADKHVPAKIRGVVIYATAVAVVLQDSSGGVFISPRNGQWPSQPSLGQLWEMDGTTDSGYFSPVIIVDNAKFLGYTSLPEPVQPTRDQLINGNMDAEYGELHGVITSVSASEITLLTPDGKVTVMGIPDRPLPELPETIPGGGSIVGSVVRIRGCFATLVDLQTRQVTPDEVYIYPSQVEVEDASPPNPFLLPTKKISDLMWFDARASALQRTKLAGQVIYAISDEYFVMDGDAGFRVLADHPPSLAPGDLIEAVGFPTLGGSSPVLKEAQIRKTGHAPLPHAAVMSPESMLDRDRDSILVRVDALLISDTIHQNERILELQSGPRHFVAREELTSKTPALLPAGCRLSLTGVYANADEEQASVGANIAPFEILLNGNADIVVLQQPPWWTIRRAIIVIGILGGILGVTFVWVALLRRKVEERTEQLKKEIEERQLVEQHHAIERERTRVAQDLHDELGAGLTEVSMLGSLANAPVITTESKKRYLEQLTQVARSLVTSLDEIVWAVNPRYDSVASLVSYFSLFAESFLGLAGIACRFQVPEELPDWPMDSKVRHGIFCSFKEVLNNAIRHSKATVVQIIFEVVEDNLVLSIIDNGRGFEFVAGEPGKDGLISLRQRMQQLGGDCQIQSKPDQGTEVEIRLPLNKTKHG
ncbi:MAG TPA: ATP-binding protein [Verrucomicrobiae bacterium]|nr:ATP-binding protein [Verrucomicrobiae bacterium]